jgi:hypothetical protein
VGVGLKEQVASPGIEELLIEGVFIFQGNFNWAQVSIWVSSELLPEFILVVLSLSVEWIQGFKVAKTFFGVLGAL